MPLITDESFSANCDEQIDTSFMYRGDINGYPEHVAGKLGCIPRHLRDVALSVPHRYLIAREIS